MKLPRWLSDVHSLEARTGWPRPLCKRFVTQAVRRNAIRAIAGWYIVVAGVHLVWAASTFLAAASLVNILPERWAGPLIWASWLPVAAGMLLAILWWRRERVYSELAEFRKAPWCLKCRYPIPKAASNAQAPVCPECGEPIPPEIAQLAAARADK